MGIASNLRCYNSLATTDEPQDAAFNTFSRPAPNTRAGPMLSALPRMHSAIWLGLTRPGNWDSTTAAAADTWGAASLVPAARR